MPFTTIQQKLTFFLECNLQDLPDCIDDIFEALEASNTLIRTEFNEEIKKLSKRCQEKRRKLMPRTEREIQLERLLIEIYDANESPPPSMSNVARRLKRSDSELRDICPEICHEISARYLRYRNEQAIISLEAKCRFVRAKVYELHQQSIYPSRQRIVADCADYDMSIFLIPEVRNARNQAMQELGIQKLARGGYG